MRPRLFAACALAALSLSCGKSSSTIAVTAPTDTRCAVSVANSLSASAPHAGGSGSLSVTTARDCTWSAASAVGWIELAAPTSGQGDGTVAYRIASNPDPAQRRGSIDVNATSI